MGIGPREQEPLCHIATGGAQHPQRVLGLDAFTDDAQAEVVPEVDDRAHDRGVRGSDQHVEHEALVDLELVDREGREIAERRLAPTEVVEADANADVAEPSERARGTIRIVE